MARSVQTLRRVLDDEGIDQACLGGRQHYLRWATPTTARLWDDNGLDYSDQALALMCAIATSAIALAAISRCCGITRILGSRRIGGFIGRWWHRPAATQSRRRRLVAFNALMAMMSRESLTSKSAP